MLLNLSNLNLAREVPCKIHIGDEWVNVPQGYIHLERDYVRLATGCTQEIPVKEMTDVERDIILRARVDFYDIYKAYREWLNDDNT